MDTERIFSERLRYLRQEKGVSQQKVANELGITKVGYQNYEYGRKMPSFQKLPRLAEVFNVPSDYLLGLSDDPHLPRMDEETRNLFLAMKAFKEKSNGQAQG